MWRKASRRRVREGQPFDLDGEFREQELGGNNSVELFMMRRLRVHGVGQVAVKTAKLVDDADP